MKISSHWSVSLLWTGLRVGIPRHEIEQGERFQGLMDRFNSGLRKYNCLMMVMYTMPPIASMTAWHAW
jgi:hypothetical protein